MYLHLGQQVIVRDEEVVGIFDLDITSQSYLTREFLSKSEQLRRVVNVSEEIPRSFVLCDKNHVKSVYISQLASTTLQKRWERGQEDAAGELERYTAEDGKQ